MRDVRMAPRAERFRRGGQPNRAGEKFRSEDRANGARVRATNTPTRRSLSAHSGCSVRSHTDAYDESASHCRGFRQGRGRPARGRASTCCRYRMCRPRCGRVGRRGLRRSAGSPRWRAVLGEQCRHQSHRPADVVEEQFEAGAEIVEAGVAVGRGREAVLRTSAVAGEAHIAVQAVGGSVSRLSTPKRCCCSEETRSIRWSSAMLPSR